MTPEAAARARKFRWVGHVKEPAHSRVLRRVTPDDARGCWLVPTTRRDGYAYVDYPDRRRRGAHIAVYEALIGPVPEGLQLDHLCRVRNCVNPAHLEPVTGLENTLRGESDMARNARKTHCPAGHPYDESNTRMYRGRRYCRACQAVPNTTGI